MRSILYPIEEWKPTIPSVIKIKRNDFVVSLKEYKDSATKDCKMRRCFLRTSHNRKKIPTPHASPKAFVIADIVKSVERVTTSSMSAVDSACQTERTSSFVIAFTGVSKR